MHTLLFANPTFHRGLNVTVRLGTKWHQKLATAERVNIASTEKPDEVLFIAELLTLRVLRIGHERMPELIVNEHDDNCRTVAGLRAELERVYAQPITDDALVTVVEFNI